MQKSNTLKTFGIVLILGSCCSCSNFWRTPPSTDSTSRGSLQDSSPATYQPAFKAEAPARQIENNAGELLEGMGQEMDKGVRATKRAWSTPSERSQQK